MDFQRTLLIGAIAVLSFMLLTEWVAFKEEKNASLAEETTRLISNGGEGIALPELEDSPTAINTVSEADQEDIPAVPVDSDDEITLVQEAAKDSSRFIEVHTDVLQFAIDLEGGDIVELSLRKYLAELDDPGQPLVLLEENKALVYIAQSGLIGADGIDNNGRAMYTSTSSKYRLEDNEDTLLVDLSWQTNSDIKVTKRYILQRGEYLMDVQYLVENNSDERWQANLFGQIKRGNAPVPSASDNMMGMQPFLGVALTRPEERFTKFSFEDIQEDPFKEKITGGWIAIIQHYFLSAWSPRRTNLTTTARE